MTGPATRDLPQRPAAALARRIFLGVAAVASWLGLLFFPLPPGLGLDASWQLALNHDWTHGLAFGREVVFTYGPWGWLTTLFCSPDTFYAHLVWDLLWKALCAILLVGLASRLGRIRGPLLILGALVVLPFFQDTLLVLVVAGLTLWLIHAEKPHRGWLIALLVLFGLLSLQKFTSFVMIAGGISMAVASRLLRRDYRQAAWLVGGGAGSLVVGWLAAGQNLFDFPLFLQRSAIVASGYSETMFFPEPPFLFAWGLAAAALYLVLIWERPTWVGLPRLGVLLAFGLMVWKHGFVRADGHMLVWFSSLFFFALAAPAGLAFGLRRSIASWLLAAVALTGACRVVPDILRTVPQTVGSRLSANFSTLLSLAAYRASFDRAAAATRSAVALPAVKARVGRAMIDQFGFDQVMLLSNDLAYAPRPVLQSYQAYSGPLALLNENYYRSPSAPAFTLAQLQAIDNRYPPMEDARLLPRLVTDHDLVLTEKNCLLLRRRTVAAELALRPLTSGRLRYQREECPVPDTREAIWARIDTPPSWLGVLRIIFYKPPEVTLVLRTGDGADHRFRFIAPAGRGGFLLSPFLESTADLEQLSTKRTGRPVQSFHLEIPPADAVYFLKRARYELHALSGLTFSASHQRNATPP